jgi:short-subunit dehydrogenase
LRKEVVPLGITVTVVEPGAFRTDFAGRSLQQSAVAIDDYAETAGLRRKENDHAHGTQRNDPARGAQAIISAVTADEPPFMLLLGPDAIVAFRSALDDLRAEVDAWAELGRSTEFQD